MWGYVIFKNASEGLAGVGSLLYGVRGFFRRWQKVAGKRDFTEFVGILWESVIFLI